MGITSTLRDSVYFYLFKKIGMIPQIRQVNFAVTYRCNSRCLTCNIWENYLKCESLLKKELLKGDIKTLFSQFRYLRVLGITGGEPFLRNDLIGIVDVIKVPSVTISTNGLMPRRIAEFTKKILGISHVKELGISVSMDAIERLNNKIRGIPDSYEKSLATIKELKKLQKKNKKLLIGISNTISKANINDVLKVYGLSKRLGVLFSTRVAQSSGLFYKNISSKIFIDEKDMPDIRRIFQFLLKENPRNIFYRYYLNNFLKNPNKQPIPCFSGYNSFFVDPYGNLYPCIMLNKVIGNLKEKSLKELLNSNGAKELIRYIAKGKCSCWTDCEALNSLYSNPFELFRGFVNSLK